MTSNLLTGFTIVLATLCWVLIDASAIGIKAPPKTPGRARRFMDNGPVGWFFGCLAMWIIVFPVYLVKRHKHLKQASIRPSAKGDLHVNCPTCQTSLSVSPDLCGRAVVCPSCQGQFAAPCVRRVSWYRGRGPTAIGWALYAVVVVCCAFQLSQVGFAGLARPWRTPAAIELQVRKAIQEHLASHPLTEGTEIKSLSLTNQSKSVYRGTLVTQKGDRTEERELSVVEQDDGQLRWELAPGHGAEARSLEWNRQDADAAKNGNIAVALQRILRNPDCKTEAEAPAPSLVLKTISEFYGKPLKLSGRVYGITPLSADSNFGKAIGQKPGSELLLVCSDKTVVDMLCTSADPKVKAGDSATVFGLVAGTTQVPNPVGGIVTRLVMVGSECEPGLPK